MRRRLNHVNNYFEVTIPSYLSEEFKNHFQMTRETCEFEVLTQEIMHTGRIPTDNSSGRPAILPEKQIQWNPVNTDTKGTGQIVRINGVSVLSGLI